MHRIEPLENDFVEVFRSADPQTMFSGSPGIIRFENGRLLATYDIRGSGVEQLPGIKHECRPGYWLQGYILISDDGGLTWTEKELFPFLHARPFIANGKIYILGHAGDLAIMVSEDQGETWSETCFLTEDQHWHQAPANYWIANDSVYIVMERRTAFESQGWPVSDMAPVLMRGALEADLTERENWTFASELSFQDIVNDKELDMFGVPFYPAFYPETYSAAPGRQCAPIGWLETNVVQFTDPDHIWTDTRGHTFHMLARAHTGGTGFACLAKVIENEDGSMTTMLEKAPSGKTILYIPMPGGQMKFHILYDETTKLFWLLSTQATDSLCRPEAMPADRYNLPNNERRRLVLYFSKNCLDWCFAGLVAKGDIEKASRHYASMAIDGKDLAILSRSGDKQALHPHDGNLVTFHRVKDFRALVY